MKNLKEIFLIFFIFFSLFTGFIGVSNKAFASRSVDFSTINLIQKKKDIAVHYKTFGQSLSVLADNSVIAYTSNRANQNSSFLGNNCISILNRQFDILSENLYSNSYFDSSAIGISLLLFEIQPNAP